MRTVSISDIDRYLERGRKAFPGLMDEDRRRKHETYSRINPYQMISD